MEEVVREFKAQLDVIVTVLSALSERVNKLGDTSPCQGNDRDICSCCLTLYKGTEKHFKDIVRQINQKDQEDKVRDGKLEELSQAVAKYSGENLTKSKTAVPKTISRIERVDEEPGRNAKTTFPKKSFHVDDKSNSDRPGKRRDRSVVKRRLDGHSGDEKSSDSENETYDTTVNIKVDAKTKTHQKHEHPVKHKLNPSQDDSHVSHSQQPIPWDGSSHVNGNILKPNFKKSTEVVLREQGAVAAVSSSNTTQSSDDVPVVVAQTEKEYYLSPGVWDVEAKAEEQISQRTALRKLEAVTTILLIDTSQSMANGDTWRQVKTFVNDYIDGLDEISTKYQSREFVALVTFGAQTRCHQRYTNDLHLIRAAFNKLQLGGPSPLYGGLTMAESVALTCEKDLISLRNGMLVFTKIILITDGEPTEVCLHRGPDIPDPKMMDETTTLLMSMIEEMPGRSLDLFCVPVGNSNRETLNLLFSKEGGRRFLNFKDGSYFSRRLYLTSKFEVRRNLFFGTKYEIPRGDPELTAVDFAHMQDILDDANAKSYEEMKRKEQNPYEERLNSQLLKVGSRVRRGPDWTNGIEDDGGPGTVVGHNLYSDRIWVNWDKTDELRQYSYGEMEMYAVFPADEPRIPLPGQPLAVGCVVTTGKDWKDAVVPTGSRGVIIKMGVTKSGIRKALVRWENGKRGVHSYGDDKIYEIILCITDTSVPTTSSTPSVPAFQYSPQRPSIQHQPPEYPAITFGNRNSTRHYPTEPKPKNKNKNVN